MTDKNGNRITVGCKLIGYFPQESGGVMQRLLCVPRMVNKDKEIFTVFDSNCFNPLPNSSYISGNYECKKEKRKQGKKYKSPLIKNF